MAVAIAVGTAFALAAATAHGAGGKLDYRSCVEDTGPPGECARQAAGLGSPSDLVVSPDGRDVYVTGYADDAIVQLKRNRRTGALRVGPCIEDPEGPGTCEATVNGLDGAIELAISDDGRHVYTIAYLDSTLLHFKRNRQTGALTFAHCVDDAGLAPVDDVCADTEAAANGLQGPQGLALSPDGRSLYVASQLDDAVVRFKLNRAGKPLERGCFEDDDKFVADDCTRDPEGLGNAQAVVVAPNGRSLYVAASDDDAVTRFKRAPRSGALAYRGCVDNRTPAGPDDCARSAEGLREAYSIGISPDGRYLYTGTINDGSMAQFRLGNAGQLRPRGCIEAPFSSAQCATVAQGIGRAADFAFDSAGRSLYVVGGVAIQPFKRFPGSGELIEQACIEDDDRAPSGTSCTREAEGLGGTYAVAMSPDDDWLYTASQTDSTIGVFSRGR